MIKLSIIIIYNGVLYENNSHNIRIIPTNCQIILNKYEPGEGSGLNQNLDCCFPRLWLLVFHDFRKTQKEEKEKEEQQMLAERCEV